MRERLPPLRLLRTSSDKRDIFLNSKLQEVKNNFPAYLCPLSQEAATPGVVQTQAVGSTDGSTHPWDAKSSAS